MLMPIEPLRQLQVLKLVNAFDKHKVSNKRSE